MMPGKLFNHSVIVQNQSPSADGLVTHDLSVNPLSMLLVNLRPLNDTGTLTNFASWFDICNAINLLTIRHRGNAIVSARGQELAALAVMRHNYRPWLANPADTNNERLHVTLPIFLGKRPYDSKSCFPETSRGEFQLEMDLDIADTGYDDLDYSVEAVEILGAKPTEFERKVQLSASFGSTGINDVDIQRGNWLRGLLLFGNTAAGGASPAPTFGRLQLIADGIGVAYSAVDWETLVNMTGLRASIPLDEHIHTEADTGGPTHTGAHIGEILENHAFLDLDPTMDDEFTMDTSKVNRMQIRSDAETADAYRVLPVERMLVGDLNRD